MSFSLQQATIYIIAGIDFDESYKELQEHIHNLYNEGRVKDPEVFKDDIRLSREKLRSVVSYFQDINLVKTDLDSKGRAFEAFMGSYFAGTLGNTLLFARL